ncbi:uncharacterized protein VICG_00649 [Vittaforma corneae ATCC 50505]|uniref:Uncharacterized protein n=1 Tax=Vittaforma corneae (strain ATCC 50505) TaxID=993615 RepID=L2GP19_VITCO|nr:uncharacterized protein VICG_00649 [Vittaforma corneae ATCC 50505]ELA42250.1 hypothetical protein VICG_00649 [Vittaforma corneae ATCC 50505]
MHRLERLAMDLPSNSGLIKEIEKEVEILVQNESCAPLFEIQSSKVPSVHIFLCKILEKRIRRKTANLDLDDEIQFCTQLLLKKPSYQVCEVYCLLGLYCWPALMPSFIDTVISMLSTETGYQILLMFLEKVNADTTIDDKRRTELKKAISIIYSHLESSFDEKFASFIIPIFTELLKILPKNFNFSLVFKKAAECPEETISFINEGLPFIEPNKITEILQFLPADQGLIQTLGSIKLQKIESPNKIYEYVFRSLGSGQDCFVSAIDFWQKVFSSKTNGALLEPVLTEALKNYINVDEDSKEEVDQHIFGFFSIICKNFPFETVNFLKINGDLLPTRISSHFIQKLAKAENSSALLLSLSFKNPYLNCLVNFLRNDSSTPTLLFGLDFTDKENVKLGLMILEKYPFTSEQLMYVLKMCENSCLNANEIKVDCYLKLGIHESFGSNWSMDDVIKYFYYLKKNPGEYSRYKDYFYSLFLRNAPFDRCFSIIEKIGDIPGVILQDIYEKMDKYLYIDLCCLNNDLLISLDNPKPYIEKEVVRFVTEWNSISDHKDYYQALKSLLTIFSAKIDTVPIIDNLLDLLQIDSSIVLNKVISILSSYKGPYNVNKAVYYLMCAYNNPSVSDSHPLISGLLTDCMLREDGPVAFSSLLSVDINRCCDIRQQILKVNKKTAQNMVRDLIKDFKGKPFSKMFQDGLKVTKQDFLPPKAKDEYDYDLKNANFV